MTDRYYVFSDFEALPKTPEKHRAKHRTKLPPTEKQLERIKELSECPEMQEHLDWLHTAIIERNMLNTRGQAGILITQMKKKCGLI